MAADPPSDWLYLTTKSFPSSKADSVYVQALARAFTRDARIRFTLFARSNADPELAGFARVTNVRGRTERARAFNSARWIAALMRDRRAAPRVVFTNEAFLLIICKIFKTLFRSRVRIVADWHMPFSPLLTRAALRSSDLSVTTSDTLRKILAAALPAHADSIRTVYGGVSPDYFVSARGEENARAQLGLPEGVFLVGYAGGFRSLRLEKGILTMLDALALSAGDLHMALIGGSEEEIVFYTAEARKRGVESRAHFYGRQSPADIARYECALDALVIPYPDAPHYRVAFPMKTYEYLAAGRPIIYSDLPLIAEVLRGKGLPFVPGDPNSLRAALERARAEPAWRAVGEANARSAAQFSWDAKAAAIVGLALAAPLSP